MKKLLLFVVAAFLTAGRIAAQTATVTPSVTTYDPAGGQITLTASIVYPAGMNIVTAVVVKNGGTGYTTPPTVTFVGGGGSGAAATATLDGRVVSISVGSGGTGYTAPTVNITGGGGTGATATATLVGGSIVGVTVNTPGTGFTSVPTVLISDATGSGASGTASITNVVSAVTVTSSGSGYAESPAVSFDGGSGSIATADALVPTPTALGFQFGLPSGWALVSTAGPSIPQTVPVVGATDSLGYAYTTSFPANSATFTAILSYPAGLPLTNQTVTSSAIYRSPLTNLTVAPLVFTPVPVAPTITTQPANVTVAAGAAASFTVAASGFPVPTLKWQRSTDNGATFADVVADSVFGGVTTSTLSISATSTAMNGNRFRAVAISGASPNAISNAAVLTVTQVPVIGTQASSQSVVVGGTAVFAILASGLPAPTYQWYFTPTGSSTPQSLNDSTGKLSGTHTSTLSVSAIQAADAGDYVCVATNAGGSVTSVAAQLSIADRVVRVVGLTAAPGATIVVPIQLVGTGTENAVAFSLIFDPAVLSYQSTAFGAQSADASLTPNSSQASAGRLGILIGKPAGLTWAAGAQEVVKVTFLVNAAAPNGALSAVSFGNVPISQEVVSAIAAVLPAGYQPANITVLAGFEADMNGNGVVTASDWVKVGRIVAGLDPAPSGVDFMKADCSPRTSLGNGVLSASDWVQAGRYAAGLDPLTPVGGPTGP